MNIKKTKEHVFLLKFSSKKIMGRKRCSSLLTALEEARVITGYLYQDKHRIDILQNSVGFLNPHSFIGVINYLIVLEIIGAVFTNNKSRPIRDSFSKINVGRALIQYSSLSEVEIDTIYALRNSLAHDYGLANFPKNARNINQYHKFTLIFDQTPYLIKFPRKAWDGKDFINKSGNTLIGVYQLIDLVESCYGNLIETLKSGDSSSRIVIDELKTRYTYTY